jgi:hypothetical protein
MSIQPVRSHQDRRPAALALLLVTALMVVACAGLGNVSSAVGAASTAAVAISSQASGAATQAAATPAAVTPAPGATTAAAGGAQSTARCQTIGAAYMDFQAETPWLAALASDGAYSANTPDSPTYINIPKVRADLDVLGTLPNGSLGPISPAIAQIRQLVDQVDANFKSGSKPFSDGSGNGQKVIDLYAKIAEPLTVVAEAFASACPHFTAATAAPDVAGYQISQTASVGDLRVTVDSVTVAPPLAYLIGAVLQPGWRWLQVHITVQNAGQTTLQVGGLETSLKDGAGTVYGSNPFAGDTAARDFIDGAIPAGGTLAGLVFYAVPASAGDLLWIFQDYGQNRAVFAVPASAIDTSQAGNAATQDALQSSYNATVTAMVGMAATGDAAATAGIDLGATQDAADLTATPAP